MLNTPALLQCVPKRRLKATVLAAAAFLVATNQAVAQEEHSFVFFHGQSAESRIVVDNEDDSVRSRRTKFKIAADIGSDVCMVVANAHPVYYRYSLDVAIDTAAPELPDIASITGLLASLPGYLRVDAAKEARVRGLMRPGSQDPDPTPVIDSRIDPLLRGLGFLKEQVDRARLVAVQSDVASLEGYDSDNTGFRGAVKVITALPKDPFAFNDPELSKRFSDEIKGAREWAGTDVNRRTLVDALAVSAEHLIAARDKLRADYAPSTIAAPRLCKTVAPGRNTIHLVIAKAVDSGRRDVMTPGTGNPQYAVVEVNARYRRAIATLDPLTLAVFAREVPVFAIRNDTLRQDRLEDPTLARPGVMFTLNPLSFGDDNSWGLGIGVGVGFSAQDIVSDVLGAATVSFRDIARVGIGLGKSSQPTGVKGASVDDRIPSDLGPIDKALETGRLNSRAWYLLLSVPGFTLAK